MEYIFKRTFRDISVTAQTIDLGASWVIPWKILVEASKSKPARMSGEIIESISSEISEKKTPISSPGEIPNATPGEIYA